MAQEIVEAPMTGRITSVEVKVGDAVKERDTICVIEAMKMEIPITAPVVGTVCEIKVTEGQVIKAGDLIAIIEN